MVLVVDHGRRWLAAKRSMVQTYRHAIQYPKPVNLEQRERNMSRPSSSCRLLLLVLAASESDNGIVCTCGGVGRRTTAIVDDLDGQADLAQGLAARRFSPRVRTGRTSRGSRRFSFSPTRGINSSSTANTSGAVPIATKTNGRSMTSGICGRTCARAATSSRCWSIAITRRRFRATFRFAVSAASSITSPASPPVWNCSRPMVAKTVIMTDSQWRGFREPTYGDPQGFHYSSIPEIIDARRSLGDWTSVDFDAQQACLMPCRSTRRTPTSGRSSIRARFPFCGNRRFRLPSKPKAPPPPRATSTP